MNVLLTYLRMHRTGRAQIDTGGAPDRGTPMLTIWIGMVNNVDNLAG
jgi:hypothetical protein